MITSDNELQELLKILSWKEICQLYPLSENLINKYQDYCDWRIISNYQKLSEDFIEAHDKLVNWIYISASQKLSEKFIAKHKNQLSWGKISLHQNLSENFIREYENYIKWFDLRFNNHIMVSDNFTVEFDQCLGHCGIWMINSNYHRIIGPAINDAKRKQFWYRGIDTKINSYCKYKQWLKTKDF